MMKPRRRPWNVVLLSAVIVSLAAVGCTPTTDTACQTGSSPCLEDFLAPGIHDTLPLKTVSIS